MQKSVSNPMSAALIGLLLILPFVLLNAIVGNQIEPFFSLIRPNRHTSAVEYILLAVVLLILPIGALIAARPILQKGLHVKRRFYFVNGTIAAILLVVFILISVAWGTEIYRCDVLQIPNCD